MLRDAYRLAMRLGRPNVRAMLREISSIEWFEWKAFIELEGIAEERADYRAALIVQALWDVALAKVGKKNHVPLADYVLKFGDNARPKRPTKPTIEEQRKQFEALKQMFLMSTKQKRQKNAT